MRTTQFHKLSVLVIAAVAIASCSCTHKSERNQQLAKKDTITQPVDDSIILHLDDKALHIIDKKVYEKYIDTLSKRTEQRYSPSSMAYWFEEANYLSPNLVKLAEPVWKIKNNKLFYNWNYLLKWHNKCESSLVAFFDENHNESSLDIYQKADSALSDLWLFFDEYGDHCNVREFTLYNLQSSFVTYSCVSEAIQILASHPNFVEELNKWYAFHKVFSSFCVEATDLSSWGGSGAGKFMAMTDCRICQERLADMKRIRTHLPDIEMPDDISAEDATADFQQHINSVLQELDRSEDEDFKYFYSGSMPDYMVSYKHLKSISPALVKAYQPWYNIRQELENDGIIKKSDNEMINKSLQNIIRYL